jgi:hypothetical protein
MLECESPTSKLLGLARLFAALASATIAMGRRAKSG